MKIYLNLLGSGFAPIVKKKRRNKLERKDQQLNEIRDLLKSLYGDLSTEALLGIFSTLVTESQLQVLIDNLKLNQLQERV
jgi:tyrosine-protein phosphatase YwqE